MDVDFTPEDMAFREEVRSFIEENYPKHLGSLDRGDMTKEDCLLGTKFCTPKAGLHQVGRQNSAARIGR